MLTPEERHVDLTQQEDSSSGSSFSSPVRILEAEEPTSSGTPDISLIDLTKDEVATGSQDVERGEAKEIINICSPSSETKRPGKKRQRRSIDSQSKDKRQRTAQPTATSSSGEGEDQKESLSPAAVNARAIDNLAAVIRCGKLSQKYVDCNNACKLSCNTLFIRSHMPRNSQGE